MTEFICPEKGCTAIFGDWGSLQDHLREDHQVEAPLEQYNEARRQAGLEPLGMSPDVGTDMGHDKALNMGADVSHEHGGDVETHVSQGEPTSKPTSRDMLKPTSAAMLSCPYCGATTNAKGEPFKDIAALRGHCLGAHHKALPEGVDAPEKEDSIMEPMPDRWEEDDEEAAYPDSLDTLNEILKEHGIKKRQAILRRMSFVEPENLAEVQVALSDFGINTSRQRSIIQTYSDWLGIEIPNSVAGALQPPERTQRQRATRSWPRDYGSQAKRGGDFEEFGKLRLYEEMGDYYETKRRMIENPAQNRGQDSAAQREIMQLRQELAHKDKELEDVRQRDLFRDLIREEVGPLKDQLNDMLSRGETLQQLMFAKTWTQDATNKFLQFFDMDAAPPTRKRGSPSSIGDILRDSGAGEYLEVE